MGNTSWFNSWAKCNIWPVIFPKCNWNPAQFCLKFFMKLGFLKDSGHWSTSFQWPNYNRQVCLKHDYIVRQTSKVFVFDGWTCNLPIIKWMAFLQFTVCDSLVRVQIAVFQQTFVILSKTICQEVWGYLDQILSSTFSLGSEFRLHRWQTISGSPMCILKNVTKISCVYWGGKGIFYLCNVCMVSKTLPEVIQIS